MYLPFADESLIDIKVTNFLNVAWNVIDLLLIMYAIMQWFAVCERKNNRPTWSRTAIELIEGSLKLAEAKMMSVNTNLQYNL